MGRSGTDSSSSAAELQDVQSALRAPFGRRDQTIVDTAVRNTWQLDPANFQLTDAGWPAYVQQAVKRCCGGLGVSKPSAVQPQLYKLLLYEAGGFFAPHRDTEKERF
ncbi:hypothetical protein WJX72_001844 [[Myrmecia] bisecta]|uniref:Uncharacterized protein n=1 Tax=[Myrmecia] bisecta TaxID=41462 RepID=A0AAW1PJJ3_9CHLO